MKKSYLIAGAVLVFLWAWLVWPTPWIHTRYKAGDYDYPVMINRVTGTTYMFYRGGWINKTTNVVE